MVPEVACKLIKDPVDAFSTDVFVVVDRKSRITPTLESKLSVLI